MDRRSLFNLIIHCVDFSSMSSFCSFSRFHLKQLLISLVHLKLIHPISLSAALVKKTEIFEIATSTTRLTLYPKPMSDLASFPESL